MSNSLTFEAEPFAEVEDESETGCSCKHCTGPQAEVDEFLGDIAGAVAKRVGGAARGVAQAVGLSDAPIIDLTGQADKSIRKGKPRDMSKVYALVLHQMACCFKPKDPMKRFLKLKAHFAILADGRILQLHPLDALIWASHGFNSGSVAVEFAGNFPNTKGQWWQGEKFGKNHPTREQIEAGRALLRHLRKKMNLTHVLAHRQAHNSRSNDPGPDIWKGVGQWGIDTLGLKDGGAGFKIHTGQPIPEEWRKWSSAVSKELEFETEVEGESDEVAHDRWEELEAEADEFEFDELELDEVSEEVEDERGRIRAPRIRPSGRGRPRPQPQPRRKPSPVSRNRVRNRLDISTNNSGACVCPEHGTEFVRWVQSSLNQVRGLQLPISGRMDAATRSALRSFQQQQGLSSDGIAGPETERALVSAKTGAPASADTAEPPQEGEWEFETLELDQEVESEVNRSSIEYAKWVQSSLNKVASAKLVVDGVVGTMTRAAVRSFQGKNGLMVDGVVGPQTEAALIRAGASQPPGLAPAPKPVPVPKPVPAGSLSARAAAIAQQEWQRWGKGTITEGSPSIRPVLEDYWRTGVGWLPASPTWWSSWAWSAAFISWVMRKAGAGNDFRYSSLHTDYVAAAKANRIAQNNNPFKTYRRTEIAPRVGDLVCLERSSSGVTYDNVDQGSYASHCDVVVEVGAGSITTIGGNLDHSVRTSRVPTDSQGRVTSSSCYAIVRVGP